MTMRASNWLRTRITGKVALVGLAAFLVFGATALPAQASRAAAAGRGAGSPDVSLFYSPDALTAMAEAYGEDGRAEFIRARWTFDLVFPAIYGFFYVTAITWLFGRGFPSDSKWQSANLVPIAAVVFDLLENSATSAVMAAYPAGAPMAAALAPWFTLVKWILVGLSTALVAVGLVAAASAALRRTPTED